MKTKFKSSIRVAHSLGVVCAVALVLQFGVLAGSAQTGIYLFTGSMTTITLNPGTYDITAYGAQGGSAYARQHGGLGAEMEARFAFPQLDDADHSGRRGGRYGVAACYATAAAVVVESFFVNGSTPLVIAAAVAVSGPYIGPGGQRRYAEPVAAAAAAYWRELAGAAASGGNSSG